MKKALSSPQQCLLLVKQHPIIMTQPYYKGVIGFDPNDPREMSSLDPTLHGYEENLSKFKGIFSLRAVCTCCFINRVLPPFTDNVDFDYVIFPPLSGNGFGNIHATLFLLLLLVCPSRKCPPGPSSGCTHRNICYEVGNGVALRWGEPNGS